MAVLSNRHNAESIAVGQGDYLGLVEQDGPADRYGLCIVAI